MQETWIQSLGQEDPLEESVATHSIFLAWIILWTEKPGGLWFVGSQSQTWLKWLSMPAYIYIVKWKLLSRVWLFTTPWTIVHRILQARILEWIAFPFSRRSFQPRDPTQVSCIAGRFFNSWATREAHIYIYMFIYIHLFIYIYKQMHKYNSYIYYMSSTTFYTYIERVCIYIIMNIIYNIDKWNVK